MPDGKRLRYMEVADDIRKRVREGVIKPGSRVGTFSSLGKDYGVAIGTVNKALDVLRQEGTVVTIAGKGIFAAETAAGGAAAPRPGDRRLSEQLEALAGEVRRLATRMEAAETQAGFISELRETVATLQAQVISLYHSTGLTYPYEESVTEAGRKVG
jgi:GntR family transcriptional regulator